MNKKILKLVLLCFLLTTKIYSQTNYALFQNKEYIKVNDEWKVLNTQDIQNYSIIDNMVTIKFSNNTTPEQIQIFQDQNNLIFLRKAITGWYDFQIQNSINIFAKSEILKNSSLVSNI